MDLAALNDEITALVRAGVPLDAGLDGWGRDVRGRLGRLGVELAAAAGQGQAFERMLAENPRLPPVYRAVVAAGLKAGRLPAALESLSNSVRRLQETRSALILAMLYPLIVLLLAYALALYLAGHLLPSLTLLWEAAPPRLWTLVASLAALTTSSISLPGRLGALPLAVVPPGALLIVVALWWLRTRRAIIIDAATAGRCLFWIPPAARIARNARAATMAEVLGLLVEHEVPLHDALVLATECTADRRWTGAAREIAEELRQGANLRDFSRRMSGFPPLLGWLVSRGGGQQTLATMSRHLADSYRRQIARDAQWLRDYLPMWLTIGLGGVVVALYCISWIWPFSQLMQGLGENLGDSMRIRP